MIDNEANPPGIKHEFRVWCVRHRNGEIEIFGWVQNVELFQRDDARYLHRVRENLGGDEPHKGGIIGA
jgi:hypothetical protein